LGFHIRKEKTRRHLQNIIIPNFTFQNFVSLKLRNLELRQSVSVLIEVQRYVLHCCSPQNVVTWRPYDMHFDEIGVMNVYGFMLSPT
jgi:hypothetical protein